MSILEPVENSRDHLSSHSALINEYKGNLFEYLVAHELARKAQCEAHFLASFGGEAKDRLVFYQNELMNLDRDLYLQLPLFAQEVCRQLYERLEFRDQVHNILVLGKSAGAHHDQSYGECDLMIMAADGSRKPVSLKFCKRGAYVNTKSGGIRSFIKKYFEKFESASEWQQRINQRLDISFETMARELYSLRGLSFAEEVKPFHTLWDGPELPGELAPPEKEALFRHYYRMISELFAALNSFIGSDKKEFIACLAPLIGLTDHELLQVTCFHHTREASLKLYDMKDFLNDAQSVKLKDLKSEVSSLEISLGQVVLQVRVKPMNKFTVSAMKINCSVKSL